MTTAPMDSKALDETPSKFSDPNLIDQPHEARAVPTNQSMQPHFP